MVVCAIRGHAQSFAFSTLAGVGCGSSDGTNSSARFFYPRGGALDNAGNYYVADTGNHTIRKITPAGVTTTLAGLAGAAGNADGTNNTARFNGPSGVAVDAAGNLYVTDTGNHTIRMITPAGVVTTIAGRPGSYGAVDGTNSNARLNRPIHLVNDASTNLYVADTYNHLIRKIQKSGTNDWVVTTLAGLGGISGSADGTNSTARFNYPWDVAVDGLGNVYVADAGNSTIRAVTAAGIVTTLAGLAGVPGMADGTNTGARFNYPCGLDIDSSNILHVADGGNYNIRRVTLGGVVTTLAGLAGNLGSRDGSGTNASFSYPCDVSVSTNGTVFVADSGNNVIRKVSSGGTSSPFVGLAAGSSGAAEGTNTTARFSYPQGVTIFSSGIIYVSDSGNHTIRKIVSPGVVTTLAGLAGSPGSVDSTNSAARFNSPAGIAVGVVGNVYVADRGNHTIRKITPTGAVTNFAGLAGVFGSADGTNEARFSSPSGVAIDTNGIGNVYVADTGNNTIRMITQAGVVSTLAGLASVAGPDDGTNSTARFSTPTGVAVDIAGNVYVADTGNHTIRKITTNGVVTTLAGLAGNPGHVDGTNSAARFMYPRGIAVDASTNIYVADTYGQVLRRITPDGTVSTLGGWQGSIGVADDVGTNSQFYYPHGIAVDSNTNLYVADTFNSSVRLGTLYNPPFITGDLSNQTVFGGDLVSLSVSAAGAAPFSYQWRKNGTNIVGETNAVLVFTSVGLSDTGIYDVVISNAFGTIISGSATVVVQVPPNDLFANAITLTNTTLLVSGSNLGAVKEAGEPNHTGNPGGKSVWWKWTAPADSTVTLSTGGSSFDTMLAVYTGNSVGSLTPVVANDDFGDLTSATTFGAKAGKTYRIAVDGFNGAAGNIYLFLVSAPPVAPSVISSPKPQTDIVGANVAFSVAANGSPPLNYRWRKNGTNISGATNSTFSLVNINATNAGVYDVVVTNEFGSFVSSSAALTITNGYTFSTLAGTSGYGAVDGLGDIARFHAPSDVATDAAGNVYVADSFNFTIRKVTPAGLVTTIAGVPGVAGSADGTNSGATFYLPAGITVGPFGNIFIADGGNHTIRKMTPAGVVTTIAGLAGFPGGADGTNQTARFYNPASVALDNAGNIYVADSGNNTIRKVTPAGVVTTIAGQVGVTGTADGTNTDALFNDPSGVAVDSATNIYVADYGSHTIRKINAAGVTTTLAGNPGFFGGDDGTNNTATFRNPASLTLDALTNIYVADTMNHSIRKVTPAGVVSTLAGLSGSSGSKDGTNSGARFSRPTGITSDNFGNIYVADTDNHEIRKSTLSGVVTTLAGTIGAGSANGPAANARFNTPASLARDFLGNVYVADNLNATIRKIATTGIVSTPAGMPLNPGSDDGTNSDARFSYPSGVAADSSGNVFVADTLNHTIRKMTPAGVVSTYAGSAGAFGNANGPVSDARFNLPMAITIDTADNLYVADAGNNMVRKITPGGSVSTLAGTVGVYGSGDGTNALFSTLTGIAVDGNGYVYVADSANYTIRKITPDGITSTLAGLTGVSGTVDGTADTARFGVPYGISADLSGNVYVSDSSNNTVRCITPAGMVQTLAGFVGHVGASDGEGHFALFSAPQGVIVDSAGKLYVADSGNFDVRIGAPYVPPGPPLSLSLVGSQAILSWPTNAAGYVLEKSTNPSPNGSWQTVTNGTIYTIGTNYVLTNSVGPGPSYYRLHFLSGN